jgi:hypothetical protein
MKNDDDGGLPATSDAERPEHRAGRGNGWTTLAINQQRPTTSDDDDKQQKAKRRQRQKKKKKDLYIYIAVSQHSFSIDQGVMVTHHASCIQYRVTAAKRKRKRKRKHTNSC